MKKLLVVFALLVTGFLQAGSGKAIVPHWTSYDSNGQRSTLYISNITGNDLEVTVTFYSNTGTVIGSTDLTYTNWANSDTRVEAGETALVSVHKSTWDYGYAVIEWNNISTDDNAVGLVAHAFYSVSDADRYGRYAIPINLGQPF